MIGACGPEGRCENKAIAGDTIPREHLPKPQRPWSSPGQQGKLFLPRARTKSKSPDTEVERATRE